MTVEKALAIIDAQKDKAIIVASRHEVASAITEQYVPEVVVLEPDWDEDGDFDILGTEAKPVYYPRKPLVNKVADAAGISYTENCGTKEIGSIENVRIISTGTGPNDFKFENCYKVVGWAQGYKILPDGTRRTSPVCKYEFDCTGRAALEFMSKSWYKTIESKRKRLHELAKFATQLARTGANLEVIRNLIGMDTAFKPKHKGQPIVISRTAENPQFKIDIIQQIIKTPDGRQAVVQALLGNVNSIYGPQRILPQETSPETTGMKDVTVEPTLAEGEVPLGDSEYADPDDAASAFDDVKPSPLDEAKVKLEEYLYDEVVKSNPKNITGINKILEDPDVTIEKINDTISKINGWKASQGGVA